MGELPSEMGDLALFLTDQSEGLGGGEGHCLPLGDPKEPEGTL